MKLRLTFLLLASFLKISCGQESFEEILQETYKDFNVQHIQPDSLLKLNSKFYLLDTREQSEFEVSHLENAVCVGYDNFSLDSVKEFAKSDTIVVYCSIGYRSSKIAEKLQEQGFKNVFNLYGGIFQWVNSELPVFRKGKAIEEIHPYDIFWGKLVENPKVKKEYKPKSDK
ncbi:MAG: rhodanese-like domain-containing protein [Calditrichaeota bacterium]|nr:MAG: rhodanese-like domain-containing protein [Calditrichota bacterium]